MIQIDVALIAAIIGVIVTLGGLLIKAINLIRYVESKIDSLQNTQKMQRMAIDHALQLHDKRIRDLERVGESRGFSPHHQREGDTGAPFLDDI